ncbi:class I SAM-dependent methyltransferase [Amycolatopsis jiangsuensis]|uniref:O-methyltransferase involved in polyketide biosynthesis n=1 Tax=Amycolatopsis jiangsuensis TaxID=1181879 RepID=A0A840J099_9PSEU|nr:class I SAM-dependent methyltransferase [Amycolatopsis jiangsuensis]MBB4686947.1 O-methyltransferase involved in polyketide biosynthesis [Amycolatopsis jiangsuensis]
MEKVRFTEEKETMLGTLYGRALDARRADSVLADTAADEAVRRIDYDFARLGVNQDTAMSVVIRARAIDELVRTWLAEHPDAVVLHLGCGMDSRVFRLDPPASVSWFDLDYPDVIALRERLYPRRPGYATIGSSVTDLAWLDQVPADRPTLIVAEGLTMYLTATTGTELVRRLVGRFPSGRLVCDFFSTLGVKAQVVNPVVRRSKAKLHWGIDDPHELERYGLRLVSCLDATDWAPPDVVARLPRASRLALRASALIPPLRRMGRIGEWTF